MTTTEQPIFNPGQRVRVIWTGSTMCGSTGTVYNYYPSRPYPWHVRPDGWGDVPGIAFKTEELEPVEESEK